MRLIFLVCALGQKVSEDSREILYHLQTQWAYSTCWVRDLSREIFTIEFFVLS